MKQGLTKWTEKVYKSILEDQNRTSKTSIPRTSVLRHFAKRSESNGHEFAAYRQILCNNFRTNAGVVRASSNLNECDVLRLEMVRTLLFDSILGKLASERLRR